MLIGKLHSIGTKWADLLNDNVPLMRAERAGMLAATIRRDVAKMQTWVDARHVDVVVFREVAHSVARRLEQGIPQTCPLRNDLLAYLLVVAHSI